MSDIVDDMRKQFSSDDGMSLKTAKVLDDAADEIESLREQLATAQAAYLQFTKASDAKLAKATAALELAEDVLSRAPISTMIWPNGVHPQAGITKIRAALQDLTK